MPEEQAQVAAPTATADAQAPDNTQDNSLQGLLAQMNSVAVAESEVAGDEVAETATTEEQSEATETEETSQTAETEETDETDDEEPTSEKEDAKPNGKEAKNFRGRWDHLNEQERRIVELTTKRGLTLAEATRAVYGVDAKPTTQEKPVEKADPLAAIATEISAAEKAISDLETQIDDLEFDPAQRKELQKALRVKVSEVAKLEAKKELVAERSKDSAQTTIDKAFDASLAESQTVYADAYKEGTPLADALADEMEYLRAANSPLLQNPNHPMLILKRVARQIGYKAPAQVSTPSSPAVKPTAEAKRTVKPVAKGGSPIEAPGIQHRIATAKTSGDLLNLLAEFGTKPETLHFGPKK